jgi:hypothetical protein
MVGRSLDVQGEAFATQRVGESVDFSRKCFAPTGGNDGFGEIKNKPELILDCPQSNNFIIQSQVPLRKFTTIFPQWNVVCMYPFPNTPISMGSMDNRILHM